MEDSLIQIASRWSANIMIIVLMYSTIFWFLFYQDDQIIKNNFFNLLLRLEFIASIILCVSCLCLLVLEPVWLDYGYVTVNVVLTFIAIVIIQITNYLTKKYVQNSHSSNRSMVNVLRVFAILFLMTAYTFGSMIFSRAKYGSSKEYKIDYLKNDEN
ncbi:MAG: hypothetical protein CMG00_09435 [Candidatus Marinimicrobia bacterium]|nr:hypothetical protein [Candidatus Neomarinimicrobiota bacterium]|tara:strand:+ start:3536 stop:4006 length:471 start_codon:yes stop_codon:yes gene_type:complete